MKEISRCYQVKFDFLNSWTNVPITIYNSVKEGAPEKVRILVTCIYDEEVDAPKPVQVTRAMIEKAWAAMYSTENAHMDTWHKLRAGLEAALGAESEAIGVSKVAGKKAGQIIYDEIAENYDKDVMESQANQLETALNKFIANYMLICSEGQRGDLDDIKRLQTRKRESVMEILRIIK